VDILDLLKVDHTRQRGLIRSILDTTDSQERLELLGELSAELAAHAAAEEETFYAALLSAAREQIQRSVADNDRIVALAHRLRTLDNRDPAWPEAFATLAAEIESHLGLEETEIFPRIRRVIKGDKARRLARLFVKTKLQELSLNGAFPIERASPAASFSTNERRSPGLASASQAGSRHLRGRPRGGLPGQKSG